MKRVAIEIAVVSLLLGAIVAGQFVGKQPMADPPAEVAYGASEPRSPDWPRVRADFIKTHPACAACGYVGKENQVHHVSPFHLGGVNERGESLELDPTNLITLCGPGHRSHHIDIGHGGNYRCRNPNVREDAERFRKMREAKVCD